MYYKCGTILYLFGIILFIISVWRLWINVDFLFVIELIKFSVLRGDLYLYFDWIRLIFGGVVMLISGGIIIYRNFYIIEDKGKLGFCILVVLFVIRIILILYMPNLWSLMLGWDGLGMVSYCLVIYYQNENSRNAGMITVLSNRIGDIGILLSIVFVIDWGSWGLYEYMSGNFNLIIVSLLIMIGAITKRAQIPFSAWLPAAIAAPTPVSALVHSSTLVTAGVYLLIRYNLIYSGGIVGGMLLGLSRLTLFISGLGALLEIDIKKVIALSTLRQLGVIIIRLSVGLWEIAFFHLLTHAIFKAMLFICAGFVIHNGGRQDLRGLSGLINFNPIVGILMLVGRLSLGGFPFISGFYSKDYLLEYFYINNEGIFIVFFVVVGTLFTIIYSLRLIYYILWMGIFNKRLIFFSEEKLILMPIFILGLLSICLGGVLRWLVFLNVDILVINYIVKIFNLYIVFLGLLIRLIFLKIWNIRKILRYFTKFFRRLWYLRYLTGRLITNIIINWAKISLILDQGWFEEYREGGFVKFLFMRGRIKYLELGLKLMIIIFVFLFLLIIFI
jgi:NADH-ubiquinone oxidoreductase chain 5